MNDITKLCPICNKESHVIKQAQTGYKKGDFYDVAFCENCEMQYVLPIEVDEKIYDKIYSNIEITPGYNRYFHHSQDVKNVLNPLEFLAQSEPQYLAVYNFLKTYSKINKNFSLLDIGSGLGYMTYSLRKANFKAYGIDLSKEAVDRANIAFGPYYDNKSIETLEQENKKFEIILLLEVIEHLKEPVSFINSVKSILTPNGKIIITTPIIDNKKIWDTELPPVHFWWFSFKSLEYIANKNGMKCEPINIDEYTSLGNIFKNSEILERNSILDENYLLVKKEEKASWKRKAKRLLYSLKFGFLINKIATILGFNKNSIPHLAVTFSFSNGSN